jgi:hypothetical protein
MQLLPATVLCITCGRLSKICAYISRIVFGHHEFCLHVLQDKGEGYQLVWTGKLLLALASTVILGSKS